MERHRTEQTAGAQLPFQRDSEVGMNRDDMTTQENLADEIRRQQARFDSTRDPGNRLILASSIKDLLSLYRAYPQTLWIADPGAL